MLWKRAIAVTVAVALVLGLGACKRGDPSHTTSALDGSASGPFAARDPATIRREGNHLLATTSAYLRAHAHDPVEWYPWGPEALARAKAENKPIFLSIGYVACHWCHVMQHEVFAKDDVARVLNERYVSIKVDREERPDLDRLYLAAVEAFSGSGGWPATLFLTPRLEPFFGATYVEHDRFLGVLDRAANAYAANAAEVAETIAELRRALARHDPDAAPPLTRDELHAAALGALASVDQARGGFKGAMKFPLPGRWAFLLHAWRKWGDDAVARALQVTLAAMAEGALRDPVRGGFHRYATDGAFRGVHFEEMLYDNAQLASLYLEAGSALSEPRFVEVATETLDFIVREMTTSSGAFAASFDADTEQVEGVAWTWSKKELVALLGPTDGATVAALLDVDDGPPRAPNRQTSLAAVAARTSQTPQAVEQTWAAVRPRLRDARSGKASRDDKIVAAWNGLAISALAQGAALTGKATWREAAVRAAEHVWQAHHEEPRRLRRTSTAPPSEAVLDDYACLASGYLALFEAGADEVWLERTLTLVEEAKARFLAPEGGFYAGEVPPPFERSVALEDGAEPSGNAVLLHVLLRLANLGARGAGWDAMVKAMLTRFAAPMRERGLGMATWLDAALLDAGPFYEVVVAGAPGAAAGIDAAVRDLSAPWITSVRIPAAGATERQLGLMPGLADKRAGADAGAGAVRVFVCERGACKAPTADVVVVRKQLMAGWLR